MASTECHAAWRNAIAGALLVAAMSVAAAALAEAPNAAAGIAERYADEARIASDFMASKRLDASDKSAPSLIELFLPILRSHPESPEGKPATSVKIAKRKQGGGFVAEIVQTGYLDDSVAGERFVGFVTSRDGQWMLESLWQQQLCWRGETAGKWTAQRCP